MVRVLSSPTSFFLCCLHTDIWNPSSHNQDFSTILATICASLANFLKLPNSDPSMLDIMGGGDELENLEDDKFAAEMSSEKGDSSATSLSSGLSGRAPPSTSSSEPKPRKKKVVASWDDEEEEEEEEEEEGSSSEEEESAAPTKGQSPEEIERGFMNVYRAFSKLRLEFDTKFKAIFA